MFSMGLLLQRYLSDTAAFCAKREFRARNGPFFQRKRVSADNIRDLIHITVPIEQRI